VGRGVGDWGWGRGRRAGAREAGRREGQGERLMGWEAYKSEPHGGDESKPHSGLGPSLPHPLGHACDPDQWPFLHNPTSLPAPRT
jgi:hypothetical protein